MILNKLKQQRTNLGWFFGLSIIFLSVILSYLTGMVFASLEFSDHVKRILPAMMMTPILMSVYGLWFLFSNSYFTLLKKFFIVLIPFLVLLFLLKG